MDLLLGILNLVNTAVNVGMNHNNLVINEQSQFLNGGNQDNLLLTETSISHINLDQYNMQHTLDESDNFLSDFSQLSENGILIDSGFSLLSSKSPLEYHYDGNLLSTHGIKFCSYYVSGGIEEGQNWEWDQVNSDEALWDFVVLTTEDNVVNMEQAFLQINVLNIKGKDFYGLLNEFHQTHDQEYFSLADLSNFFEGYGYDVMQAR